MFENVKTVVVFSCSIVETQSSLFLVSNFLFFSIMFTYKWKIFLKIRFIGFLECSGNTLLVTYLVPKPIISWNNIDFKLGVERKSSVDAFNKFKGLKPIIVL